MIQIGTKTSNTFKHIEMALCQNLVPLVNIKIAGKWMFIPLKMVLIGIDPYPNVFRLQEELLNGLFTGGTAGHYGGCQKGCPEDVGGGDLSPEFR